jgi:hypothetical protein
MAHFALVNDSVVDQVIVIANENCDDLPFPESEPVGQAFIASLGLSGEWLQTSYNANFRGAYAGIGFTYDEDSDSFVAPEVVEP